MTKHEGWAGIGNALGISSEAARWRWRNGSITVERTGQRVWATDEMLGLTGPAADPYRYTPTHDNYAGPIPGVEAADAAAKALRSEFLKRIDCEITDATEREAEDERADVLELEPEAAPALTIGPFTIAADSEHVSVNVGRLSLGWDW